ncbi:glycosyltransferase [Anaerohalosphaera lusitana]|nr:glycosyltransferase [Anaerohalosphaera lusitana]
MLRKTRSILKCYRRESESLHIYSPVFLPFQGKHHLDSLNNTILRHQLSTVVKLLKFKRPIVWVENVRSAEMISSMKPKLTVYHVSDLFAKCKYTANKVQLGKREQAVTRMSDLLICVSQRLYDLKRSQHSNVHYIPHGVDYSLFKEAAASGSKHPAATNVPSPIIGYYGSLTPNNDIETLKHCADKLPSYSFILAGQITGGDYEDLLAKPNVHYIGKQPYEQIPSLCASFDVCLLPWRVTDWIRHCNPLKLAEYMASGRPIVSVRIDEVASLYNELISVADSPQSFCDAIVHELTNDTEARSKQRQQLAQDRSWTAQVDKISELIASRLEDEAADRDTFRMRSQ